MANSKKMYLNMMLLELLSGYPDSDMLDRSKAIMDDPVQPSGKRKNPFKLSGDTLYLFLANELNDIAQAILSYRWEKVMPKNETLLGENEQLLDAVQRLERAEEDVRRVKAHILDMMETNGQRMLENNAAQKAAKAKRKGK